MTNRQRRTSRAGWTREFPATWSESRAKFLFVRRRVPAHEESGIVTAFRDGQVTLRENRRIDGFTVAAKEIGYQGVRRGDLVIHSMDGFAGAIGVSDSTGKCSPVYLVCRASPTVDARFQAYALRHMALSGYITSLAKGIRERSTSFGWAEFGEQWLPLPPVNVQRTVADYLDRKTAAIDGLIENKQRLVTLLAEKRAALINQAVTKGLNPTVPMKDSGIPWIGEIPAHWETTRLKFLVTEAVAGPYGSSLTKSMYADSGYRVYGQQQVIPDDFTVGDYYISPEKFSAMRRYEVQPGDLLVSVMGTVGKVAVVPPDVEPGIMNPRLVRYRPDSSSAKARFLQLAMLSYACQAPMHEAAQGTTMDGLNMSILGNIRIPLPPIEEQAQIDDTTREGLVGVDALEQAIRDQVRAVHEYRQALITAAVTGQIDIAEEAA